MKKIKIFNYHPTLDAFTPSEEYCRIAEKLDLIEWNPVCWIGRLFCLDNDYGEHWFDNWDERAILAKKFGLEDGGSEYLIINPSRFINKKDGPCHSDLIRKYFWTNVLQSLELDLELLILVSREQRKLRLPTAKDYIKGNPYTVTPHGLVKFHQEFKILEDEIRKLQNE